MLLCRHLGINLFLCVCSVFACLPAVGTAAAGGKKRVPDMVVRDFSKKTDPHRNKWFTDPNHARNRLGFVTIDTKHGPSLKIPVNFPYISQAWRKAPLVSYFRHTGRKPIVIETIQYDVYLPPAKLPRQMRVQSRMLFKDKEGHWFEALGQRKTRMPTGEIIWKPATALCPGWNTIRVDLSEASAQIRARGHHLRWSRYALSQIRYIGFSFQGNRKFKGNLALDNITTWLAKDASWRVPLRVVDFVPGPRKVKQYELFEFSFNINRPVLNPFRCAEIAINAEFKCNGSNGSSRVQKVPAFYFQPYRRIRARPMPGIDMRDQYIPDGPGVFKVRFTPRVPGEYTCRLHVDYCSPISGKKESLTSAPWKFTVRKHTARGFIRVSKNDPRYFEFENGEFFFPLGHSLRSPSDPRHVRMILRQNFFQFTEQDLVNPGILLDKLRRAAGCSRGTLQRRIFDALPEEVRRLATGSEKKSMDPGQRRILLAGINSIVRNPVFFKADDFSHWNRVWEIADTLDRRRPRVETERLKGRWRERRNRVLLELVFAGAFRPSVTADHGLQTYESILPRMHAAGMNCFEVWMCSWWLGLEWTGAWNNYYGLGKYNMVNAWKLDRLIDLAAANRMYLHLTIDNHGKAAQWDRRRPLKHAQYDHEFEYSPYNIRNRMDGGFLRNSVQLFSDKRAKLYYRDKLRYIAARYGWSTNIFGVELWSELDLVGSLKGRHRQIYSSWPVRKWHQEMAAQFRKFDHGRHLLTTHYSGDYTYIDRNMIKQQFISYIACDAYHEPHQTLMDMLARTEGFALPYSKPFMVTEYGGFAYAAPLDSMAADLYGGLWWSWMSRTAGAPMYWWFELVSLEDYYRGYSAFAKFIKGEDKRRQAESGGPPFLPGFSLWRGPGKPRPRTRGRPIPPAPVWSRSGWPVSAGLPPAPAKTVVAGTNPKNPADKAKQPSGTSAAGTAGNRTKSMLSVLLLGNGEIFYAYVYDHLQLHRLPRQSRLYTRYKGALLTIGSKPDAGFGIRKRTFRIEFWDCWNGNIIDTYNVAPEENGSLVIGLPAFAVHIAVKIKPVEASDDKP